MILIDFLDNNIKDSLILVKSMRPSKLILVGDAEDEGEGMAKPAEHMREAAEAIAYEEGFQLNVETILVDARDMKDIFEKVTKETKTRSAAEGKKTEVYINISGENDLMTAAAYNLCADAEEGEQKYIPVCVDIKSGVIRNVWTFEEVAGIKNIMLKDYLAAVGATELEGSRDLPEESEYAQICAMAEILFKHTQDWNDLCAYIGKHYSQDHNRIRIPADLESKERKKYQDITEEQLEAFCKYGFLNKLGDDEYEFACDKYRNWMLVYGTWLELYIYIKIKPYVDEARIGMVLDWDGNDGFDTKDNELDVVVMKNSRPIIISCKMRMPTKEDIYEVGYITTCLSGRSGRSAVATSEIVNHKETYKPGIYPRFKKMEIGLLETIEIRKGESEAKACFEELF